MPSKLAMPVPAAEKAVDSVKLGPKVLMSGFMTKRTRTISMWKQRWWQLKDNGILYYYNPEGQPPKLLGEVDVGKTCYEVKLGSNNTRIKFPRAVPSCCCFSFTVLKRVFYMYTPTPDEANSWVKAILGVSRVINRRIVAGLERRKAPEIPGGSRDFRVTRIKVNEGGPGSSLDISKVQYLPLEKSRLDLMSKRKFAGSLPDYLDKVGIGDEENSLLDSTEDTGIKITRDSLQLQGKKHEESNQEEQKLRTQQLQAFSVEDISSPRPLRKPVPTPRKRAVTLESTLMDDVQFVSHKETHSEHPETDIAQLTFTPPSSYSVEDIFRLSHSLDSSRSDLEFSPITSSSPPPLPPKGDLAFIPPPPLTSPPHSRPPLSLPCELMDNNLEEVAPLLPFPEQIRKQDAFQPDHSTAKQVSSQEYRETPKFVIPPPPPT